MTETASRPRLIAIWFLRVLLGLAFLTIEVAKLTGTLHTVAAHEEAHKHLSEEGREVLEMMDYASTNSGLSIADAYVNSSTTANLSERDKDSSRHISRGGL